jgi:Uma2 family endonuclease
VGVFFVFYNEAGGNAMDRAGGEKLLTSAEYHELGRLGVLSEDDRVELIEGEVVPMSPIGSRHAGCTNYLVNLLARRLQERVLVTMGNPVLLSEITEPQPDLMLLRPRKDCYRFRNPVPVDVLALVEVADTSHAHDRRKAGLYAAAGIPEMWLVDVRNDLVEIKRQPAPGGFGVVELHHRGDRIAFQAFPDLQIDVAELLGDPS